MNTTLMEITPQIAASFLEKNTRNRPLNAHHVKQLAKEMKTGRWKENGDTIRFNGDLLIDGQHRLMAVVESGCSIRTLVVDGLSADVFSTIDRGRRRSGGDTLALLGVINANTVAAALKWVHRITTGKVLHNGLVKITNAETEELLSQHPHIQQSVRILKGGHKNIMPASLLAALHYLFSMRDAEAADKYVHDIHTGKNLSDDDAVYLLRERLLQNTYMKQKLRQEYIAALAIKAWNARRSNRKLAVLKYVDTENFPIIAD
jgi:hypothetical protein